MRAGRERRAERVWTPCSRAEPPGVARCDRTQPRCHPCRGWELPSRRLSSRTPARRRRAARGSAPPHRGQGQQSGCGDPRRSPHRAGRWRQRPRAVRAHGEGTSSGKRGVSAALLETLPRHPSYLGRGEAEAGVTCGPGLPPSPALLPRRFASAPTSGTDGIAS